jgi:hypothetical protein
VAYKHVIKGWNRYIKATAETDLKTGVHLEEVMVLLVVNEELNGSYAKGVQWVVVMRAEKQT